MIKVCDKHLGKSVNYKSYQKKVNKINDAINARTSAGNDFLGWEDLPSHIDEKEVDRIIAEAEKVRKNFDVLVVCGIGGSYLGARAAIEAINGLHPMGKLEVIFMGQTFSSDYIAETLKYLEDKKFAVNVISKSGTTTETSISFRLLKNLLVKKYGEKKAKEAIFATTDSHKGALHNVAEKEGYVTFDLPGNVGGRYSVLTPVGLFPIACAGIDIKAMIKGAKNAENTLRNPNILENEAYKYAVIRDYQYRHGKATEMFVTYEPRLVQLGEWFKQLFGESEGKEHKGLLPDSATFSTDLHSLGQFIQDGTPKFFETVLFINKSQNEVIIPECEDDGDQLNYLAGKNMDFVNEKAFKGTLAAHSETAKVPNVVIKVETLDVETLGYLFYFFEKTCAMSAYLLGVNPFNQPGVEIYKKNMFSLLGKKGY